MPELPTLVSVNTHPMTTRLAQRGQLAFMREHGLNVVAVASPGWDLGEVAREEGVRTISLSMQREISPLRDFVSLVRMYFLLRRLKPAIVHAGTPKASLLSMIAAWAMRVPVRIYALKGLRLETVGGWKRKLLAMTERITAGCATRVLFEGPSLRDVCIQQGLVNPDKAVVLGSGMLNGLDAVRYDREQFAPEAIDALRTELKIPRNAFVIGFVGRFVKDKGIIELFEAYQTVLERFPTTYLLLVGDFESGDPVPNGIAEQIESHPQIILTGFVSDTAPYYQLMNLHALPSYREGFPNTPMEAAAAGVPTVGFVATGTVDAVLDGITGTLVPRGDAAALAAAIERYLDNPALFAQHAQAARHRARTEFQPEPIWQELLAMYTELLEERGITLSSQAAPSVPEAVSTR